MKRPLAGLLVLCLAPSLFGQGVEVPPAASTDPATPLTIEQAVALAIANNERAAIAETTVEAAEARVRLARTAFFPRVDIGGTLRSDFEETTDRTLSTSALLTQPIFDARAFPLYRQTRFERDAARLNADETTRILGYDAAASFLRVIGLEQVLLAAENRRAFGQTNLDDVRARFEAGLVSSNDVTRAELELATAVRGVAQAAGDVQSARIDLQNLINVSLSGPLAAPVALLDAADNPPAEVGSAIGEVQQGRKDIAAARARVEALRAFSEEPSARFLPSVLLSAQTRNINDGPISNRNNDGFVGVSFAWPLLDAGVRSANRAERVAQLRGAELSLQSDLREVERELKDAAVQLTTAQAALREATAALRAARKNADETNALYREGLASALELADANRQLFEAEVAEVTARYGMAVAYLSLEEARGADPVGK